MELVVQHGNVQLSDIYLQTSQAISQSRPIRKSLPNPRAVCFLPPCACCVCLYSPVVTQTSGSWLIYPLPCESGDFESVREIKILISPAGLHRENIQVGRVLLCKMCWTRLSLESDLSVSSIMTQMHTFCRAARVLQLSDLWGSDKNSRKINYKGSLSWQM